MRRIRKTKIKWQRFHGIFINTLQLLNFKSKMQWTWYELCFQAWRLYYSWFPERIWWYGCCMVSLSCLWCPSIFRNVFLKCVSEQFYIRRFHPLSSNLYQKMLNFQAHLLIYVKGFPEDARQPKRLRKS